MKKQLCISIVFLTLLPVFLAQSVYPAARLDSDLQKLADQVPNCDTLVSVVVFLQSSTMRDQVSLSAAYQQMDRASRLKLVTTRLQKDIPTVGNAVVDYLEHHSVTPITRHWIVASISARIPASALKDLANLPGIDQIAQDARLELVTPVSINPAPGSISSVSAELTLLGVPTLWQQGITGKGRLVCSFDTGVEGTHPALASKWRGNHAPLNAAFFSLVHPDTTPYDFSGHGTHTMGIMVGSSGSDSFGVAPGAEWINAAVIDQGPDLPTTISNILSAFEWVLDPDGDTATTNDVPDVILNSWGLPTLQPSALAPCSTIFWQAIDNVEAAGIVTIFAAGNEGRYGAMTIRNPANRASTPLNAFCVGAIGDDKTIADFSSRGPSSCDTTQIKPEVVAPGISIRSSYKGGGYAYLSGTSMAAPYIAGLVALCRQYNPDATVDQIKYAIIQSAQDLGAPGEDNDYGNGLPDASKLIQFLPAPHTAEFSLANQLILGNGVAVPGSAFSLELTLTNSPGNVDRATGHLTSNSPGLATVLSGQAQFAFGTGGTTAVNDQPFQIQLSSSVVNGSSLPLTLELDSPTGKILDSLTLTVVVGYPAPGATVTVNTGRLNLTISDFGQFGFAPGSIYNLGAGGLQFDSTGNLLYEAGIIVGRNTLQMAGAIRNDQGLFKPSDFRSRPSPSLGAASTDLQGGVHHAVAMTDAAAAIQIPTTVRQEIIDYPAAGDNTFVIMSYYVVNTSLEAQSGLHFGFLADFDLSAGGDRFGYSPADHLLYQHASSGVWIGVVSLSSSLHLTSLVNGSSKRGISSTEKFALLSAAADSVDTTTVGDLMFFVNSDAMTLSVGDSSRVAFALVAGYNYSDLVMAAADAQKHFDTPTDVTDRALLPGEFNLSQNYPNPFNPSTTIKYELRRAGNVTLTVYNLLGRHIRTIFSGKQEAGSHVSTWDGRDDQGKQAATGVYFYRLSANGASETRKMLLLK